MIDEPKHTRALRALHHVLITGRVMAYQRNSADAADLLDTAEYLVVLLLQPADGAEVFRQHLVSLARRWPVLSVAVARFDGAE